MVFQKSPADTSKLSLALFAYIVHVRHPCSEIVHAGKATVGLVKIGLTSLAVWHGGLFFVLQNILRGN